MPERAEGQRPEWAVRAYANDQRGLSFGGDWTSAHHLAELLSGEDEERVTEDDVRRLLDIIEAGMAVGSGRVEDVPTPSPPSAEQPTAVSRDDDLLLDVEPGPPLSLRQWARQIAWGVTTEADCYGVEPIEPERYALYDAGEDDPPIAVFDDRGMAEQVALALRAFGDEASSSERAIGPDMPLGESQ